MDSLTIQRSKVVVDLRSAALAEAGDLVTPINAGEITADHIYADLGEIVTGKSGRTDAGEITFFKSVGLAIQDALYNAMPMAAIERWILSVCASFPRCTGTYDTMKFS